jgi:hypothetical protein
MATLKNTTINDTGFLKVATGTTAERPSPLTGMGRFNSTTNVLEYYNGTTWVGIGLLDGSSQSTAAPNAEYIKTVTNTTTNGWYWINAAGLGPDRFYCDMNYSGGGWTMVIANTLNTGGMSNLTYADATTTAVNIRRGTKGLSQINEFNMWVGLNRWAGLCSGATKTIVQYVAGSSSTALGTTGSHAKRSRWTFTGFGSAYNWLGVGGLSNELGGTPGMYSYHTAYNFTTYDVDQDAYSGNCSAFYSNNPWWYGACWSGSYFGGGTSGGYADGPFWDGSGTDYHTYGAVYIK